MSGKDKIPCPHCFEYTGLHNQKFDDVLCDNCFADAICIGIKGAIEKAAEFDMVKIFSLQFFIYGRTGKMPLDIWEEMNLDSREVKTGAQAKLERMLRLDAEAREIHPHSSSYINQQQMQPYCGDRALIEQVREWHKNPEMRQIMETFAPDGSFKSKNE